MLKEVGITVFHVVPTLRGALKAVDAAVDVAVPFGGQVMGRVDEVRPVADILRESWDDCQARLRSLGQAAG